MAAKKTSQTNPPAEAQPEAGKKVRDVAGGELLVCLERFITAELVRAMAARKPQRVVCLDAGFADDQLKANAVQAFKAVGTVFKTV